MKKYTLPLESRPQTPLLNWQTPRVVNFSKFPPIYAIWTPRILGTREYTLQLY